MDASTAAEHEESPRPEHESGSDEGYATAVFRIDSKLGLNMRVAGQLSRTANEFSCQVLFRHGETKADAKSMLGLMMLGVKQTAVLQVIVDGADATAALKAVRDVIHDGLGHEISHGHYG